MTEFSSFPLGTHYKNHVYNYCQFSLWYLQGSYDTGQIPDWSVSGKHFSQRPLQKVNNYLLHTLLKKTLHGLLRTTFTSSIWILTLRLLLSSLQKWPCRSSKSQELKEIKIITCLSGPSASGLHVFSVMERSM